MKILFVCSANICRSALAEVILRKKLQKKGLTDIVVNSAGVDNYAGEPRDPKMASLARQAGYDMGGIAQYITRQMADAADLIICMEYYHVVELQKWYVPYARWSCIHRFNEICFNERTDMVDPSGDTDSRYQDVFEKIQEGCNTLACKLSKLLREGEIFFR